MMGEAVLSLGLFSVGDMQRSFATRADAVRALVGQTPDAERESLARYLRAGRIVFAAMEHTSDILDGSFGTPGGSGILTDGTYYWRGDTADYVDHYGVGLPEAFVAHARRQNWERPHVSDERLFEIDRFLMIPHEAE